MSEVKKSTYRGISERAGWERLWGGGVVVGAILVDVALWLTWHQRPGPSHFTSIFGSVDREGQFVELLPSQTGWSAAPLLSGLLAAEGVAAVVFAA